jgi:hypothetical protein
MRSGASVNRIMKPSTARNFSLIGAMRQSVSISPVILSPSNDEATAPWTSTQKSAVV